MERCRNVTCTSLSDDYLIVSVFQANMAFFPPVLGGCSKEGQQAFSQEYLK